MHVAHERCGWQTEMCSRSSGGMLPKGINMMPEVSRDRMVGSRAQQV